ncbi:putative GABA permease [Trichodelitschia bisporula]|uniref:Putative GABA permease n=1 Tax=Trichodelitschia bisporula TaxID=703511 RepID=A0A6G1I957_9PEZI|nr:putative GABA permease [Trichodelitschia bisporula]
MAAAEQTESKEMYHEMVKETGEHVLKSSDSEEMYRMGKDPQFRRLFRQSTMIMFTSIVQQTWEAVLIANGTGLLNGGLAGLVWSYVWTFAGFMLICLSLGEMASMAPTNGGQYHWVSEFAPRKYQRFLSYMSGWMSVLSWQAGLAGGSFLVGTIIQGTIANYNHNYTPKAYQGTLFSIAITTLGCSINIFLAKYLPRIQKLIVVPHAVGWIVIVVFLWVLAPHASAKEVFTNFTSEGWQPIGLSMMVGQVTSVWFLIGSDSSAHLSEEVKDAGKSVPSAMMWTLMINGLIGFIVLVTFCFALPDVTPVFDPEQNPSGFAFLYVFQNASYKGAIPLIALLLLNFTSGATDFAASTSRQLFAFARDGGTPFGPWLAQVQDEVAPRNAIMVTWLISVLLSLINLGSTIAFNAIISLQLLALMSSYCLSIGCLVYQRLIGGHNLPPARWSLGRLSLPINLAAFLYSAFILFWVAWPQQREVTAETFNWSSVMFVAVFVWSLTYYYMFGRKSYAGPVVLVRGR